MLHPTIYSDFKNEKCRWHGPVMFIQDNLSACIRLVSTVGSVGSAEDQTVPAPGRAGRSWLTWEAVPRAGGVFLRGIR